MVPIGRGDGPSYELFVFVGLGGREVGVHGSADCIVISYLRVAVLCPEVSEGELRAEGASTGHEYTLRPRGSGGSLLGGTFCRIFLVDVTVVVVAVVGDEVNVCLVFQGQRRWVFLRRIFVVRVSVVGGAFSPIPIPFEVVNR